MVTAAHAAEGELSPAQALAVRAELKSVLESESFASSRRCRDFLELVVELTIAGDQESLTERFLGVRLFGRAVDYETATDSIVRVRANDVRRRLVQHYSSLRPGTKVRIDMTAGSYVPEFHWETVAADVTPHGLEDLPDANGLALSGADRNAATLDSRVVSTSTPLWRSRTAYLWAGIAVLLVLSGSLFFRSALERQSNFDAFWQPVLDAPGQPVLNLPTTDTFQLMLDPKRTVAPLSDLQPGQSLKLEYGDVAVFHDWHVSVPVVQATLSVALALGRKGKAPLVRIGTDLSRDELRGHPIIAIGSFSNPWTEETVSGLRFTFDRGPSDREAPHIRDAQNPQRSWSLSHTYPEAQRKDYAIITRTFDPVTREPFVSLAGLHSFGNQIAAEFVSQEATWNEVARRAPRGWQKMNLQILLEADIVGTTPSSPRIVDVHFWK